MRQKIIIGLLLLAASNVLQAQTNQGTDFWLAETSNELSNGSVQGVMTRGRLGGVGRLAA